MSSFNVDLLTVMGVLAGLSALLFLLAAIDPSNAQPRGLAQPMDGDGVGPGVVPGVAPPVPGQNS